MSARLAAVTYLVPDYEAGLAFLVGVLGFEVVADHPQGAGKRWILVRPPGGGSLMVVARATGAQAGAIGRQAGGRVGFFLAVDDFAAWHARLAAAGLEFLEAPRHEPYGTVVQWADPFGNLWDLIAPAAGNPMGAAGGG